MRALTLFCLGHGIGFSLATFCDNPSPSFLLPNLDAELYQSALEATSSRIASALAELIADPKYNTTHFSIEVTSQHSTIYSAFHTALERSTVIHGAKSITNTTAYRIASMTKPFTVLALLQLQESGKLSLDHSVLDYLPSLNTSSGKGSAGLPWKDITLRSLAGQSSGVPSNFAQVDMIHTPETLGLPPLDDFENDIRLPQCDQLVNYTRACNATEVFDWIDQVPPVFAPNQRSSYSNMNFDLLGLVIANVSGMSYENYIQTHILDHLGMKGTSFTTPPDKVAAITKGVEFYWNFEIGVQNPTGGLYSSSGDMSTWLRYVLGTFNAHAKVNWFAPTSFSGSVATYYGMPWEIFRARSGEVAPGRGTRPLTFVQKGGGLPGYTSNVVMVPEMGFGVTILIAGEPGLMPDVQEVVVREMVEFVDDVGRMELMGYVGRYEGSRGSVALAMDVDGLVVESWESNGVDVLKGLATTAIEAGEKMVVRLVPTLLYVDESTQQGEKWRFEIRKVRTTQKKSTWDNYCVANIEGPATYAGRPVNEFVFWGGGQGDAKRELHLTGFRTILKKVRDSNMREIKSDTQVTLEL